MGCCGNKSRIQVSEAQQILDNKNDNDWLYQSEVQLICEPCYESMIRNNITKIRKEAFLKKLRGESMKFYEIIYTGPKDTKFNLGGHTLEALTPKYFDLEELPFPYKEVKKMNSITITQVELDKKPDLNDISKTSAKLQGVKGVMWVGASPRRVNEFGTFVKDIPNFSVSQEGIEKLRNNPSYKILE